MRHGWVKFCLQGFERRFFPSPIVSLTYHISNFKVSRSSSVIKVTIADLGFY